MKSGFQTKYDHLEEDILKILDEKRIKTSAVQERLVKLSKRRYKDIHYDWVKKTLIRMLGEGKIEGGKDPDFGIYLWSKKEGIDEQA